MGGQRAADCKRLDQIVHFELEKLAFSGIDSYKQQMRPSADIDDNQIGSSRVFQVLTRGHENATRARLIGSRHIRRTHILLVLV